VKDDGEAGIEGITMVARLTGATDVTTEPTATAAISSSSRGGTAEIRQATVRVSRRCPQAKPRIAPIIGGSERRSVRLHDLGRSSSRATCFHSAVALISEPRRHRRI
jgi:hypothetical protein